LEPAGWVALAELLKRCLAVQPQDRYPDGTALAEDLQLLYESLFQQPYPRPTPDHIHALADGLNNQAVSLLDLGHETEALCLLDEALQADRNHLEALYNRIMASQPYNRPGAGPTIGGKKRLQP
jgi:hypothetical protein